MLTEPAMQARYLAATLGVIQARLQNQTLTAVDRSVLCALISSAARVTASLLDQLPAPTGNNSGPPTPPREHRGNVLAFKR